MSAAPPSRRQSRLRTADRARSVSLGSVANASVVVAALALVVGAAIVWVSFSRLLSTRDRVIDELEPAQVETLRLRAALLDQETGLRGFALSQDSRFLEPYERGQRDEAALQRRVRDLVGDSPAVAAQLDRIAEAMSNWRSRSAEPIIAAGMVVDNQALNASRAAFDDVRDDLDVLDARVADEFNVASSQRDAATVRLGVAFAVAFAAAMASALFSAWLLKRRVVLPIEQLVGAADRVAVDRTDVELKVAAPREIEHLADRVDQMRHRIVTELSEVKAARSLLSAQTEELARSNRDLEQFAYVASHDLQEPLRKVASFCQLLEQRYSDSLDERGRQYIGFAVDGATRMQALISDLLEFSRVGRTTERFVPCELNGTVDAIVSAFEAELVKVGGTVERGELPAVVGDPALLSALVANVVGNAIKYRDPERNLHLSITAARAEDTWLIEFRDNGIGIEPQFRERVFVIFQRLHGRDEFSGTGIGLALCRKIAEFHGGAIRIGEPAGPGTAIEWIMPVDGPRLEPDRSAPDLAASDTDVSHETRTS